MSLGKHKVKCGEDGNAIYNQCREMKRTNSIIECKSLLHLLNNVDGHEEKFDTDNATHFAVEYTGRTVDIPRVEGTATGFIVADDKPVDYAAYRSINTTPRGGYGKITGPASKCMAGAQRVPSLGMYEVVEEKTWRDVLPSKTFSSFVPTAEFENFVPTAEVPFFIGDAGQMEMVPTIGEMEERDELSLNEENGNTDGRTLELIPRRTYVEKGSDVWGEALLPWEQKYPSAKHVRQSVTESAQEAKKYRSDAVLCKIKARLGVVDADSKPCICTGTYVHMPKSALTGHIEWSFCMQPWKVEALKYEEKKGQSNRERLELRPRYIVPSLECTKIDRCNQTIALPEQRTRAVEYKGTALRFTGACMPKPFDMFPPKQFSSSATMLRDHVGVSEAVYGPTQTYRLVETSKPSLFVHTVTKEGKDRVENFITNNPPLEETGVLFTTQHVLDKNWVRVEIPVDPATETQPYQTLVLQVIKVNKKGVAKKVDVLKHFKVITVPRDGTYNAPSVRAILHLDDYHGEDNLTPCRVELTQHGIPYSNLTQYREVMDKRFLRIAHARRRAFVKLVREGEPQPRFLLGKFEGYSTADYKAYSNAHPEYEVSTDEEVRQRIAELKQQQIVRESAQRAFYTVSVKETWESTKTWLLSENQHIAAKEGLPKEAYEVDKHGVVRIDKALGLCKYLRLTSNLAFAYVEKWKKVFRVAVADLIQSVDKKNRVPYTPPMCKQYKCDCIPCMAECAQHLSLTWDVRLKAVEESSKEQKFFTDLPVTLRHIGKYDNGTSSSIDLKVRKRKDGNWYLRSASKYEYFVGKFEVKDEANVQDVLNHAMEVCTLKVRECEVSSRDTFRKKYNELMSSYHHNRRHKGKAATCRACLGYEKEAEELVKDNDREHAARAKELKGWTIKARLCLMAGATYAPVKYDMLDVPDTDVSDSLHAVLVARLEKKGVANATEAQVDTEDWWSKVLTEPPEAVQEVATLDEEDETLDTVDDASDETDEDDSTDEECEELTISNEVLFAPSADDISAKHTVDSAFLEAIGLTVDADTAWLNRVSESFDEVSTFYVNRRYAGSLDIGSCRTKQSELRHLASRYLSYTMPLQGVALDVCLDAERLAQAVLTSSEWNMVLHADPDKLSEDIKYRLGKAWLELWNAMRYPTPKQAVRHRLATPTNLNERGGYWY